VQWKFWLFCAEWAPLWWHCDILGITFLWPVPACCCCYLVTITFCGGWYRVHCAYCYWWWITLFIDVGILMPCDSVIVYVVDLFSDCDTVTVLLLIHLYIIDEAVLMVTLLPGITFIIVMTSFDCFLLMVMHGVMTFPYWWAVEVGECWGSTWWHSWSMLLSGVTEEPLLHSDAFTVHCVYIDLLSDGNSCSDEEWLFSDDVVVTTTASVHICYTFRVWYILMQAPFVCTLEYDACCCVFLGLPHILVQVPIYGPGWARVVGIVLPLYSVAFCVEAGS